MMIKGKVLLKLKKRDFWCFKRMGICVKFHHAVGERRQFLKMPEVRLKKQKKIKNSSKKSIL